MKYKYVVSKIELPEWCTGSVESQQEFEELGDAMELVDELNDDCEDDEHWYEVLVHVTLNKG